MTIQTVCYDSLQISHIVNKFVADLLLLFHTNILVNSLRVERKEIIVFFIIQLVELVYIRFLFEEDQRNCDTVLMQICLTSKKTTSNIRNLHSKEL